MPALSTMFTRTVHQRCVIIWTHLLFETVCGVPTEQTPVFLNSDHLVRHKRTLMTSHSLSNIRLLWYSVEISATSKSVLSIILAKRIVSRGKIWLSNISTHVRAPIGFIKAPGLVKRLNLFILQMLGCWWHFLCHHGGVLVERYLFSSQSL